MAVKIRLRRMGRKKSPFYRIIVADSRSPRNGRFIEELGYYNPVAEPKVFKVNPEKVMKWIGNGAKPTDTVERLFKTYGVYEAGMDAGDISFGLEEKKENIQQVEEAEEEIEEKADEALQVEEKEEPEDQDQNQVQEDTEGQAQGEVEEE